jgi:hypothetical protein
MVTNNMKRPNAFIQWKGTNSCVDYYCTCGEQFHIDDSFVYAVQCPYCERRFEVSSNIELREMEPNEKWEGATIKRGDQSGSIKDTKQTRNSRGEWEWI